MSREPKSRGKVQREVGDMVPTPSEPKEKTASQREFEGLGLAIRHHGGQGQALSAKAAAFRAWTPWASWSPAGAPDPGCRRLPSPQKPEGDRSDCKTQVLRHILSLAGKRQAQLAGLLSGPAVSREDLDKAARHRAELLGHYQRVILADVVFSEEHRVSQRLWKHAFHQVIEKLGHLLQQPSALPPEHVAPRFWAVLDEGTPFLQSLLEKLQKRYRFQLREPPTRGSAFGHQPSEEPLKSALACGQKLLLCLGDLDRHLQQAQGSADFGTARSWYLQALQLDPSDPQPYNQLALLAASTKRKLDAICYWMRSLGTGRPSICSEKNLRKLFAALGRQAEDRGRGSSGSSARAGDLGQAFTRTFLQVHARLFTGTGMETFRAAAEEVLEKFQLLLRKSPASLAKQQMLLHLLTINMFAVHNSQQQEGPSAPWAPLVQGEATCLALAMFALLLRCCTHWLQRCPSAGGPPAEGEGQPGAILVSSFGPVLGALLPSVKICCEWILLWRSSWEPASSSPKAAGRVARDLWGSLHRLRQSLLMVDTFEVPLYGKPGDDLALLLLEEDQLFSGFAPLVGAPREPCYYRSTKSEEAMAANCRRVNLLKDLLESLCGPEKPLWASPDGQDCGPAAAADSAREQRQLHQEDRKVFRADAWEEAPGAPDQAPEELKVKKLLVAHELAAEQRRLARIQAILLGPTQERQLEEEPRPRCLVLDTNSFLLQLDTMSQLLEETSLTVLVPLVVILELKGLAKGEQGNPMGRTPSSRPRQRAQRAQRALDFLEQHFPLSNARLKVLSSQGQELQSIDCDQKNIIWLRGNLDDHILACCLNYQRAQTHNNMPSWDDQPIQPRLGDLALLTEDRTLRVKALASKVPVWDKETLLQEMKHLQPPPL
ncbi:telomerase-binding protein EST1A-like [Sarcophilus harrisii]